MKRLFMMLAIVALPFAIQAQTKYHDVEANDAKGPVKSITTSMMGQTQTHTFTQDGKEETLKNAVYDENGYLKSTEMEMQGMALKVTFKWENGRIVTQTTSAQGQEMPMNFVYNDKGEIVKQTMNMMGNEMVIEFSDYKYDDKGNWISRKTSVMGNTMETPRTIEYY